ncbi:MAG: hypothetical protein V9G14_14520 [Cypionkella sp.]
MTVSVESRASKQAKKMALWLTTFLLMLVMCVPGLWVVLSAFRPNREILAKPPVWVPEEISLVNFGKIFGFGAEQVGIPVGSYFMNSLIIALTSTVIALAIGMARWLCLCPLSVPRQGRDLPGPDAVSRRARHCPVAAGVHHVEQAGSDRHQARPDHRLCRR